MSNATGNLRSSGYKKVSQLPTSREINTQGETRLCGLLALFCRLLKRLYEWLIRMKLWLVSTLAQLTVFAAALLGPF
jgi:hypothetical protein